MFVSKRPKVKIDIKLCLLIVEEIKLNNENHIKYLKLLNDGYSKTINFLENHTRIFDDKLS